MATTSMRADGKPHAKGAFDGPDMCRPCPHGKHLAGGRGLSSIAGDAIPANNFHKDFIP